MARLFIPVGLPGCGKSTLAKALLSDLSLVILSTDLLREKLTQDVNDQTSNDDVFRLFHKRIEDALAYKFDVYADATNLKGYAREKLRLIAERTDASTHVLVFKNMREAVERNTERERVVPSDVMIRFAGDLELALTEIPHEGYSSVTYISGVS